MRSLSPTPTSACLRWINWLIQFDECVFSSHDVPGILLGWAYKTGAYKTDTRWNVLDFMEFRVWRERWTKNQISCNNYRLTWLLWKAEQDAWWRITAGTHSGQARDSLSEEEKFKLKPEGRKGARQEMNRREPLQQKESMARGWKELGVEPGAREEEELLGTG